jgi:hypothetical protein
MRAQLNGDSNAVDSDNMDRDEPLPGASPERQDQFEELRDEFEEEGRYPGREEEVAARIVNKQRREFGETIEQKAERSAGRAPDRHLPIRNYQRLTVPEVIRQCHKLDLAQLKAILAFERAHRKRKTLIAELVRIIGGECESKESSAEEKPERG